jgi:error-prone DNA polymerase
LVEEAVRLGLPALALTDRDGVYGVVRAHIKAREFWLSSLSVEHFDRRRLV